MILLDTNVLARLTESNHPHQSAALQAIKLLGAREPQICVSPQVLIEFYAISTRPTNGLNLTPDHALAQVENIKRRFHLLADIPDIFPQWESLIAKYKPINRRVFDARHVAFMLVHKIQKILTFNDKDFVQFVEIEVLNPFDVLGIARQ
jgi:predicted nucleic acid-binding protein